MMGYTTNRTPGLMLTPLFVMPNIQGRNYAPGWQPNSPGNSSTPGWNGGNDYMSIPWPTAVPSLNVLANNPGFARAQPVQINNNTYATLPAHNLFIAGFVGKSQG